MMQFPVNDGFDHNDKKYLCCCGSIDYLTGAYIVGSYMALSLVYDLSVAFEAFRLNASSEDLSFIAVQLVGILCVVLLFVGINKLNPRFVLPFVIFKALELIMSVFTFIFFVIFAAFMNEDLFNLVIKYLKEYSKDFDHLKHNQKEQLQKILQDVFVTAAIVRIFFIVFNYWLFNIVNRCYRYLKDYELHRLRNGSVALDGQQHIPSPPPTYA